MSSLNAPANPAASTITASAAAAGPIDLGLLLGGRVQFHPYDMRLAVDHGCEDADVAGLGRFAVACRAKIKTYGVVTERAVSIVHC